MQKNIKLKISGMHCESCSKIIKMDLEELPQISSIEINIESGQAQIKADSTLKTEEILSTIKKAGYDPEVIEEHNEE